MYSKETLERFYIVVNLFFLSYSESLKERNVIIKFEWQPEDIIVSIGSSFSLNCSARVSNNATYEVVWYKDGYPLQPTSNQFILPNNSLLSHDFSVPNEGEYLCILKSEVGARMSQTAKIESARIKSVSTIVDERNVELGKNVLLPCNVEGLPTPQVVWTKDSLPLLLNDRVVSLPSNSLHILEVSFHDAGLYRCTASNMAGILNVSTFTLTVSPKRSPSEIRLLSDFTHEKVLLNETAVLECLWSFSHSLWLQDDVSLDHHSKLGSSLIIPNVAFSDSGTYLCQSSENGSLISTIILQVVSLPKLLSPPEQKVPIKSGRPFNLTCTFSGYPSPEVRWFKNGKVVEGGTKLKMTFQLLNNFTYQSIVHSSHSTPADVGVYQCMMFNDEGAVDGTFFVFANKAATFITTPLNLRARPALNGEIQLSWDPPRTRKSAIITRYSIHYRSEQELHEVQLSTERTKETIMHMMPFTNYTFYVKAHTDKETSDPSECVSQMTNEEVPVSAPQVTLHAENSTAILVRWGKLTENQANGIITTHRVFLKNHRDLEIRSVYNLTGSVYSLVITGLQPEEGYNVKVLSGTKIGFPELVGEFWETIFLSKDEEGPLYYPEDVRVDVLNLATVKLSWIVKHISDSVTLYGFKIIRQSHMGKPKEFLAQATDRSYILSELSPGKTYELRISSMSEVGEGRPVLVSFKTLLLTCTTSKLRNEAIINLKGRTVNDTAISLSLTSSAHHNIFKTGMKICYGIYIPDEDYLCQTSALLNSGSNPKELFISNLQPLTSYYFGIYGKGRWLSGKIICTTGVPAPRDIRFENIGNEKLNISWNFPVENLEDLFFRIFYTDDNSKPLSNWSSHLVQGSRLYYVIENLTCEGSCYVQVSSAIGDAESSMSDILQVGMLAGQKHSTETRLPIPLATFSLILIILIILTVILFAALYRRRKRMKANQKMKCFEKVTLNSTPIKPFQSNNEPINLIMCNGNHHHQNASEEPLLFSKLSTPPVRHPGGTMSTSTQEDTARTLRPNESVV